MTGRLWAGGAPLVVCFPAAGSSSLSFRPLANALTEQVTVLAVEPARRRSARLDGALARMADELASELRPWLSGDVTLIGHSFGGYLSYEVARRLVDSFGKGDRLTLRLVLVGCAAPTHAGGSPPVGDDDALIESLTSLGAIPEELRREPALLRRYLPAIRADLQTVDEYVRSFRTQANLPVPALAVRGCFDPLVPISAVGGMAAAVPLGRCHLPAWRPLPATTRRAGSCRRNPSLDRRNASSR